MNENDVRALLLQACKEAGSQRKWAAAAGLSAPYVHDVIHGRREPGPGILRHLGLSRNVCYSPLKATET